MRTTKTSAASAVGLPEDARTNTTEQPRRAGRPSGRAHTYTHRATPEEVEQIIASGYSCDKFDAARILGVHPEHVLKLARAGELPGFRVGRAWRFHTARLLALLDGEV